MEDIDEGGDALLCTTDLTGCCKHPPTAIGNWFFPNGTKVPHSNEPWDFHTNRDEMVVRLNRRKDGVDGIYRCDIPDSSNVNQTIYIGVYSAGTGE